MTSDAYIMSPTDPLAEVTRQRDEVRVLLDEARRAIGDHFAPGDCYATGPLTGDAYRDLIECPACSFIAMYNRVLAAERARAEARP